MRLRTGVDISPGEKSGIVVDGLIAAIRLKARSDNCPSWHRRQFLSYVEPSTEREGAKGAEKIGVSAVDVLGWLHLTSTRLRRNGDKMYSGNDVRAC